MPLFTLRYPRLRLGAMTDGYFLTMPIEEYKAVALEENHVFIRMFSGLTTALLDKIRLA